MAKYICDMTSPLFLLCTAQGGVVLLLLCLALRMTYDSAGRKLSVEVGGAKRLQTITTLGEAALLLPLALLSCFLQVRPAVWTVWGEAKAGPLVCPVIGGFFARAHRKALMYVTV